MAECKARVCMRDLLDPMNAQLLQTTCKVRIPWKEYALICEKAAEQFASVEGLIWKVWTFSEQRHEGGGIYLFESKAALSNFLEGPIMTHLRNNPSFAEVSTKVFDILEAPSLLTGFSPAIQNGGEFVGA